MEMCESISIQYYTKMGRNDRKRNAKVLSVTGGMVSGKIIVCVQQTYPRDVLASGITTVWYTSQAYTLRVHLE